MRVYITSQAAGPAWDRDGAVMGHYGQVCEVGTRQLVWSTSTVSDPYGSRDAALDHARREAVEAGYTIAEEVTRHG